MNLHLLLLGLLLALAEPAPGRSPKRLMSGSAFGQEGTATGRSNALSGGAFGSKLVRDRDWNDYHVIVRGILILLRINDVVMSEVRGLQVHTGPPMKVPCKNVRLHRFD